MNVVSTDLLKIKILLNLDLKLVSEDACFKSMGKLLHNWASLCKKLLLRESVRGCERTTLFSVFLKR